MHNEENHITSYVTYGRVLVTLLLLTAVTVGAAWFDFKELTIAVAMLIASVKVFLVLSWFMHLKFEKLIFRLMVGMVFILIAIVFVILFFDYWFR